MKESFGRPRNRLKDNIKMYFQEVAAAWTGLIWFRVGTSSGLD